MIDSTSCLFFIDVFCFTLLCLNVNPFTYLTRNSIHIYLLFKTIIVVNINFCLNPAPPYLFDKWLTYWSFDLYCTFPFSDPVPMNLLISWNIEPYNSMIGPHGTQPVPANWSDGHLTKWTNQIFLSLKIRRSDLKEVTSINIC